MNFNEGSHGFLAQRCMNKAGRYVVVTEYGERSRRGVIMIPEGSDGDGWKSLVECFQEVVDHLGRSRKGQVFAGIGGHREGVSFADAVNLAPSAVISGFLNSRPAVTVAGSKKWLRADKIKSHAVQAYWVPEWRGRCGPCEEGSCMF